MPEPRAPRTANLRTTSAACAAATPEVARSIDRFAPESISGRPEQTPPPRRKSR